MSNENHRRPDFAIREAILDLWEGQHYLLPAGSRKDVKKIAEDVAIHLTTAAVAREGEERSEKIVTIDEIMRKRLPGMPTMRSLQDEEDPLLALNVLRGLRQEFSSIMASPHLREAIDRRMPGYELCPYRMDGESGFYVTDYHEYIREDLLDRKVGRAGKSITSTETLMTFQSTRHPELAPAAVEGMEILQGKMTHAFQGMKRALENLKGNEE